MMGPLGFAALAALIGDRPFRETPCPLCSPLRREANRRKPVLGIWRKAPDFITYSCAHCGEHGWASDRTAPRIDHVELARRMREAKTHHQSELRRRTERARWLWRQSRPIRGTIAEAYLRSRAITVLPPTLRFLPARGEHPAAMLAAYAMPAEPEPGLYEVGTLTAVHLTQLASDGTKTAKITVGITGNDPIALVPPNDLGGLAIAEGIEDALSLHQATGLGTWAAGWASRLPKLAPLIAQAGYIEAVIIAVDDDDAGRHYCAELAAELRRRRPRSLDVELIELGEVLR
jgi:phage/plasmid primase-like uncharacterized protein